jgi:hypothetical protein
MKSDTSGPGKLDQQSQPAFVGDCPHKVRERVAPMISVRTVLTTRCRLLGTVIDTVLTGTGF